MENEEFKILCDIKTKIEKLTKRQQELLYQDCISKLSVDTTINKRGVFFDLRKISTENLKMIVEYTKGI